LEIDRGQVRTWRKRWLEAAPRLIAAEEEAKEKAAAGSESSSNGVLITEIVEEVLADELRSGAPATFAPEQVVQIVALALEDPREESGRAVTHWTPRELADEAIKRGIGREHLAPQCGAFFGERRI
jgi:putative transposase